MPRWSRVIFLASLLVMLCWPVRGWRRTVDPASATISVRSDGGGHRTVAHSRRPARGGDAVTRAAISRLAFGFEANRGQADRRVRFLQHGSGYSLFLTPSEAALVLQPVGAEAQAVVRMKVLGGNPDPRVEGLEELPGESRYFIGNDADKWLTGVPTYARVRYEEVYPGIDLVFHGDQGTLEYDFIVAPGADPGAIHLAFEGASQINLDPQRHLTLRLGDGRLRSHEPRIYQESGETRRPIAGGYTLDGGQRVGFEVAAYDPTRPLIIDPVLSFSTYLGGSRFEIGSDIAIDASGNIYLTGSTTSTDFPLVNPVQSSLRTARDAIVMVLDPGGTSLLHSTYLGGSNDDAAHGIAVDAGGYVYVAGETTSTDFPTANPFRPARAGIQDGFVAKLDVRTPALVYSTYLGGSGQDWCLDVAVDGEGRAGVTGWTGSSDFPITGLLQPAHGGDLDAFMTTFDATGSAVAYSTYLGGNSGDHGWGVAFDAAGNAHVMGDTGSADFPTANALQPALKGGSDLFVAKIDPSGSSFHYSTYLGGNFSEEARGMAVDAQGNVHVTGTTSSTDFPTVAPVQSSLGGMSDALVAKIDATGSALLFSTYLGGSRGELGHAVAVSGSGRILVSGGTVSLDFPTVRALQSFLRDDTVFKSMDAADTWGSISREVNRFVTALAIDAGDQAALYAGTRDAGVYRSADGGSTWVATSLGLGTLAIKALAVDPGNSGILYAGSADGGIFKSEDAGASWRPASDGLTDSAVLALAIDRTHPMTLYAGTQGGGVFKSTDGGGRWSASGLGLPGQPVTSLAIDPVLPVVLYAGTAGGGIFKSLNGGLIWMSASAGLTNLFVNALAVDPRSPTTAYAGTGGGVFKTTDGGLAWVASNQGLTNLSVATVVIDPAATTTLYAGTRLGVSKSTDGGLTWTTKNSGMITNTRPNRPILALAIDPVLPATLYAGTEGGNCLGSLCEDAFVALLDPAVPAVVYSTYLGGSSHDVSLGIVADAAGDALVTGFTHSDNFPTKDALQPTLGGGARDAFLVKISEPADGGP